MNSLTLRLFLVGLVSLCVAVAFAADVDGNGIDDLCELSTSSASGDPHFVGFRGQRFDFDGTPFRVFGILSHPNVQLNARFVPDGRWTGKTVMGEVALQALGDRLHVACANRTVQVAVNGIPLSSDIPMPFGSSGMAVRTADGVEVTTDAIVARIVRHKTRELQCFLDMEVSLTDLSEEVDGVLGRTVSVDSELPAAHNADLFLVKSDDVFGTDFPVNRFVGGEHSGVESGHRARSLLSARSLQQTAGCGCMSSTALNYDSMATLEDGSCYFLESTSGASDSAIVVLTGDCASVVEAEIATAIATSMGVDVNELTISSIECDGGAGGRRRLLQTDSNVYVVFSVETANIAELETLLGETSINMPTGFSFSASHRIQRSARMNRQRPNGQNPCRQGPAAKCQSGNMCKLGKSQDDIPECIGLVSPLTGPCFPNPCIGHPEGLTTCFTSASGVAKCTNENVTATCAPSGCTCADSPCANHPDGFTGCYSGGSNIQCIGPSVVYKCPVTGCNYPYQGCDTAANWWRTTDNCAALTTMNACIKTKTTGSKTCAWTGSACVTGTMSCPAYPKCGIGSSSYGSCSNYSTQSTCKNKQRVVLFSSTTYQCYWNPATSVCFDGPVC